nr:thiamine pyrophosphate-dependent dehydrogenase E1 component subunit alpha [Bacteroidia bacterium]
MNFDRKDLSDDQLIRLYHELVRPRIIEEKMLVLLRQGKLAKWFSGIGQEAVSVGAAMALHQDEYVLPMHRNLGIFSVRNIPLHRLFSQWMGKPGGFTNGRDRSFHFGTQEYKIIGMISHLGPQCGIADGIALGNILKQNNKATIVFSGDGGASEGDFHEAVNVAAVWDLPVIFIVENNGYGLSTPSSEQYRCKSFADKGIGYGIQGVSVDGNNILEVYNTLNELLSDIRKNPRPIIFEARTFRMRGHEEASGTKYVPQQLFDEWGKKDPIANYENYLLESKIISTAQVESIRTKIKTEIEEHLKISYAESDPEVNTVIELRDMYAPSNDTNVTASGAVTEKRFLDAITDGLRQGMQRHKNLVIMGQDIAE